MSVFGFAPWRWLPEPWMEDLAAVVERDCSRAAASPLHGRDHWEAVAQTAQRLAEEEGVSPVVPICFGLLHDSQRLHDGADPAHGARAAAYTRKLGLPIPIETLCAAMRDHDKGTTTTAVVVGVCWDADRLQLGRIGILPDPAKMSTRSGRAAA
jgi:uncharacterized protein